MCGARLARLARPVSGDWLGSSGQPVLGFGSGGVAGLKAWTSTLHRDQAGPRQSPGDLKLGGPAGLGGAKARTQTQVPPWQLRAVCSTQDPGTPGAGSGTLCLTEGSTTTAPPSSGALGGPWGSPGVGKALLGPGAPYPEAGRIFLCPNCVPARVAGRSLGRQSPLPLEPRLLTSYPDQGDPLQVSRQPRATAPRAVSG